MNTFLISCLTFGLLFAGSCFGPKTTNNAADPKAPWSLRLNTSGGFAGGGRGNFAVDSDGKFSCEEMNRQEVRKGVSGTLQRAQLQPLSEAVAQAKPDGWNKPGLNVAAADAFGYKLELRTGANNPPPFTVQWYDNTADQLPTDLKELSNKVLQTMDRVCKLK